MSGSRGAAEDPFTPAAADRFELTGNHYLALPEIRAADAAIGSLNVFHRGLGGLLTWAGSEDPGGPPFIRLRILSDGHELAWQMVEWERLDRWIPRLSGRLDGTLGLRVTICAPGGFDPLVRGAVIRVELRNDGTPRDLTVEFEGQWGVSLLTVATTRPVRHPREAILHPDGITLESGEAGRCAALTLLGSGGAEGGVASRIGPAGGAGQAPTDSGGRIEFAVSRALRLENGGRGSFSLFLGVGPERDGAQATASRLARLGAADLIRRARLDLAQLGRAADDAGVRDLLSRNLPFHHYFGAARGIDDDRIYPVMSRAPVHGGGVLFGEREVLAWSFPAYCLTDPGIAREILMRCLELHSERPGLYRRYPDGAVVDPAYSLARACEWGLAVLRYVDISHDERILDEPLVQQVIRELDESLYRRLHPDIHLGSTEVLPGGESADFPCSAIDNVLLWAFCRALPRLWQAFPDEPPSRMSGGDEEIEAAFWRRCTTDFRGLRVIAGTTDLDGQAAIYDDPACTLALLPWYGFCPADDPIFTDTMELLRSEAYPLWLGGRSHPGLTSRSRPGEAGFAALCAELLSGDRREAIIRLKRLQLPGGVACSTYDPDNGRAASGPLAASEAGLLVWCLLEEPERVGRVSR